MLQIFFYLYKKEYNVDHFTLNTDTNSYRTMRTEIFKTSSWLTAIRIFNNQPIEFINLSTKLTKFTLNFHFDENVYYTFEEAVISLKELKLEKFR